MAIVKPATAAPDAPRQFKQPSRKGKKAWRKNVDLTEVETGLDEVREETTLLGGLLSEKASSELFTIDTVGDVAVQKKHLKGHKPLRADQIIAQRSAVPAVSMRKRPSAKVTDGIIEPKEKRQRKFVSHAEVARLRDIADGKRDGGQDLVANTKTDYDPWAVSAEPTQDPRFSFLPVAKKKVAPPTLKHKPISLAANGKEIPAVKAPEGHKSYNPDFEDYQEAYIAAGEKEVEAERKRLEEAEKERQLQEARARSAAEADAAEARAEMSEWEEDSAWEGFESTNEDAKLNVKMPKRKTKAEQNKAIRKREARRKAKWEANELRRQQQLMQSKKGTEAMIEHEQNEDLDKADETSEEGDDENLRRRKLGKMLLPQKDLELVLPDELADSLRRLKPEGNLLKDRYRSFLVRGKLETRRPIPFHRKARTKVSEKWSYKDFVLH